MSPPWAPLLRYRPELEDPEWDEEGEYKSPYLVDGEGRKIRSAGGYAILAIENEATKSMIEKYQKKKNLELPNMPITQDLENDVDVILHKRRELIENRHNAVYVEDRTLHIELWNLISATLLVLAAIPKERPEEGIPLRDWPSAVRDTWRLVQRNHREKRRLSVGWQSASSVTGADGTAISQYSQSTSDEEQNIEGGRVWEELFAQGKIGVIRKEQLEEFVEETGDEGTRTNARMILQDMPSVYHYRLDVLAYRIMGLHGVTKALNIVEGFMDKKKSIPVKLRRTVASEIAECRNHVAKLHGLYGLIQVRTENLEANLGSNMEHTSGTDVEVSNDIRRSKRKCVQRADKSPQRHDSEDPSSPDEFLPPSPARRPHAKSNPTYRKSTSVETVIPPKNRHASNSDSFPPKVSRDRAKVGYSAPTTNAQGTAKKRKRAEENEGRDSTKLGSPQAHHCHGVVNLAEHVRNFWELVQNHASSSEYSRWASSLQAETGAPGATIDTGDLAQEHFFTNCMTPILDKGFSEGDMDEEDRVNSII